MQSLNEIVTALSLDPFESLRLVDDRSVVVGDQTYSRAELSAALQASPLALDAGDWSSCDTCSDPGPDEFDPFA